MVSSIIPRLSGYSPALQLQVKTQDTAVVISKSLFQVVVPCDEGVHAKVLFSYLTKLKVVTVSISLMITTASPWRDKFSVGT